MTPMQPDEALGVAAQVAVTLAGFAGVVVVFRPDSVHRWSRLDRFRLLAPHDQASAGSDLAMVQRLCLALSAALWNWKLQNSARLTS